MTDDRFIFDSSLAIRMRPDTSAWTIPMLCIGIAVIACCVLVPAADDNRRLTVETQRLQADYDQIRHQIAVNDQFLKSVGNDPTLLERLAQRQMKMVREGESVLDLKGAQGYSEMSPFTLVNLPAPAATPDYRPVGGLLSQLSDKPRVRLFTMGAALLLMAAGLVLGTSPLTNEHGATTETRRKHGVEETLHTQMTEN